jgi:hypothetical protein
MFYLSLLVISYLFFFIGWHQPLDASRHDNMGFPSIPAEVTNGFQTLPISQQASDLSGIPSQMVGLIWLPF